MIKPQLFLDMDGVLADFDRGYEEAFGYRSDKSIDNVDWKLVQGTPGFYRNLPPMRDIDFLWGHVEKLNPIVLTGIPSSVPEAANNKNEWVASYLGPRVKIICCRSKDKSIYCNPGDALVDDWEKYQHLWLQAGGVWITHTSAANTVLRLKTLGWL